MDYFNTNFNTEDSNRYEDLPDDFEWNNMKDGIYEKMEQPLLKKFKKHWPLLLLLLFAGCGTGGWLAIEYFNEKEIKEPVIAHDEQNKKTKPIDHQQPVHPIAEDKTEVYSVDRTESTASAPINTNKRAKRKQRIHPNALSNKSTGLNTPISDQDSKSLKVTNAKATKIAPTATIPITNENPAKQWADQKNQAHKEDSPVSAIAQLTIERFPFLPTYSFAAIPFTRDFPATLQKVKTQGFKKNIEVSIAGGLTNWLAFDQQNINHDYVSGYPGWTITPSVSLFLKANHAIQIDYEYSAFEELFDFDGSRSIQVRQEDVIVREVINSLTGDLIQTEREDVTLNGTRSYREVKYNQYQLHTLSLGYRFLKSMGTKSSLGIYGGATYLFHLQSQGKRLNEQLDVMAFDRNNPLFRGNQFGLRFALSYNFKIGPNTTLFYQINGTKYLSNWELKNSASATRPLVYGMQVGLRKNIRR